MNDDMNDDGNLWVDSADRRVALRALTEHRDEQRLTGVEFDRRAELLRTAGNRADLRALFADLPPPHPQLDGDAGTEVGLVPGGARFSRHEQGPTTRGELWVLLGTGGVIVVGALVAGWWLTAVVLACFVVLVTLLLTRR